MILYGCFQVTNVITCPENEKTPEMDRRLPIPQANTLQSLDENLNSTGMDKNKQDFRAPKSFFVLFIR